MNLSRGEVDDTIASQNLSRQGTVQTHVFSGRWDASMPARLLLANLCECLSACPRATKGEASFLLQFLDKDAVHR